MPVIVEKNIKPATREISFFKLFMIILIKVNFIVNSYSQLFSIISTDVKYSATSVNQKLKEMINKEELLNVKTKEDNSREKHKNNYRIQYQ